MGRKTLWVKEKLLVTSVFKRLASEGRQKVSLCGNGLNLTLGLYHRILKHTSLSLSLPSPIRHLQATSPFTKQSRLFTIH